LATRRDFELAQERCAARAEMSTSENARRVWLSMLESYGILLKAGRELDHGALIGVRETEGRLSEDHDATRRTDPDA
jgi:hypothetical protein